MPVWWHVLLDYMQSWFLLWHLNSDMFSCLTVDGISWFRETIWHLKKINDVLVCPLNMKRVSSSKRGCSEMLNYSLHTDCWHVGPLVYECKQAENDYPCDPHGLRAATFAECLNRTLVPGEASRLSDHSINQKLSDTETCMASKISVLFLDPKNVVIDQIVVCVWRLGY